MEGLFLGLANGLQCLSYCAPVLVTFILGAGRTTRRNLPIVLIFLSGRLLGYLLFGTAAYATGFIIAESGHWRGIIFGSSYILISSVMIFNVIHSRHEACPVKFIGWLKGRLPFSLSCDSLIYPAVLGFLTGINLCPPFLLALTGTAASTGISDSLVFFLMFFVGTSFYFLPLPFLGALRSGGTLKLIAKTAAVLIAVYYIAAGIILITQA